MSKKVAVIMGSDSDLPVVKSAIAVLRNFGVDYEVRVMSAHRTPDAAANFSKTAKENGFGVIIAAAGKAAHLGGVLAAHTILPVIAVWPRCLPPCRCRAVSPWQPWRLTALPTRRCLPFRCWHCPTSGFPKSWRIIKCRWRRAWLPRTRRFRKNGPNCNQGCEVWKAER